MTSVGEIVGEFKKHLFDTQLFFDKFVGPSCALLLRAHEAGAGDGRPTQPAP